MATPSDGNVKHVRRVIEIMIIQLSNKRTAREVSPSSLAKLVDIPHYITIHTNIATLKYDTIG